MNVVPLNEIEGNVGWFLVRTKDASPIAEFKKHEVYPIIHKMGLGHRATYGIQIGRHVHEVIPVFHDRWGLVLPDNNKELSFLLKEE